VDLADVLKRVWNREQLSSAATPEGVALLHPARWERSIVRQRDGFAIGRAAALGSSDGFDQPVDVLFLLLARNAKQRFALLARVVRFCRTEGFLAGLRGVSTPKAAATVVRNTEARLFEPGSPS